MTNPMPSHDKARAIVNAALERKAEEPVALDVSTLTSFADAFVLLVGRSHRQVRSIAEEVPRTLKQIGDPPLGVAGLDEGRCVLIDGNDVICHVFSPEAPAHYDLERLWHDAEPIELDLPAEAASAETSS